MGQQALVQKSIEVATQPGNAGAIGLTTFIAGWSGFFNLLTPVVSVVAGILGGILTALLIVNAIKKSRYSAQKNIDDEKMRRLEREEKHLVIEALKKDAEGG